MSLLLDPKATIAIDVKYYDDAERDAFSRWANGTKIDSVVGQQLKVTGAEFLSYFLIHKKARSPARFPNLEAVKKEIQKGDDTLSEWVSYDGRSLHVSADVESLESTFTEHLGEAAGLVVANRIHDLNEADWTKIPETGQKTQDWKYASDGKDFVELETKGSFRERVDLVTGLYDHKADIKAKKKKLADKHHPHFNEQAIRYGTITSISKDPKSLLTVRLVDPEGEIHTRTPREARILKRLAWASWVIRLIASRTLLSIALQNRLAALLQVDDLDRLKDPLKGGTGRPMDTERYVERFFIDRTSSAELQSVGALSPYDEEHMLFFGISREWFLPLIGQQFDKISEMDFEPKSTNTHLDCVVTRRQMETDFDDLLLDWKHPRDKLVRFERDAVLHRTRAGLVFGLVSKHD